MLISRRAVQEFLVRPMASYTWMKKLDRDTLMAELSHLKVKPRFKTDPWLHQLVCFYIAICEPRFLFLLDMGLGKTKIMADVMTQLLRERRMDRALITVPRGLNIDTWNTDLAIHSDLEPWLINAESIEEKWEMLANPRGDLAIVDYQGLCLATTEKRPRKKGLYKDDKKIRHLQRTYDFIGLDESHKLSNHDNLWFSIVRQLTKTADHVYATTGTLFDRNLEDAWSQFFLVDRGETFGENLGLFRASFFDVSTNPWKGVTYTPKRGVARPFNRMLQNRSIAYDGHEVNDLPQLLLRPVRLRMGPEQREHYLRALDGLISAGGQLSQMDSQWLRMRQITSGYLKWRDEHGEHKIIFKDNPKLAALERLIDEIGHKKLIVCHDYTDTGELISNHLREMGVDHEWYYGGTKDQIKSFHRFLKDPKCQVFVMNSEAGGTGTDGLQKVANYMVFYESPTPPRTRRQTVKRIHRPGLEGKAFVYDLICGGTVDSGILTSIKEGNDFYAAVMAGKGKRDLFYED